MEAHEKRIALLCRSETSCRYDPSCCGIASNRWNEGKHFHEKGKATTSFDFLCRYDVCRQHLWMRRWVLWWFTVVQVVLGLNIDIVTTLPWRFHLDSLLDPLSKGVGRTGTFLALYKLWLDYHNPACKKWVLLLSWFISSVRSSNSHPDLLVIQHHPTFSDHTGPQHWTFTFWATTAI